MMWICFDYTFRSSKYWNINKQSISQPILIKLFSKKNVQPFIFSDSMSVSTHRKFFQRLFFVSAFPVGYLSYKDTYMVSTLLKRFMIPFIRIALDFLKIIFLGITMIWIEWMKNRPGCGRIIMWQGVCVSMIPCLRNLIRIILGLVKMCLLHTGQNGL